MPNHSLTFETMEDVSILIVYRTTNEGSNSVDSDANPSTKEEIEYDHSVPNKIMLDIKVGSNGSMLINRLFVEPLDVQFIETSIMDNNILKSTPERSNCLQEVDKKESKCYTFEYKVEGISDNQAKESINNVNTIYHFEVTNKEITEYLHAFETTKKVLEKLN